ncbi:hypothetical protein BP5796_00818 [Coleophoma crateriformis]|uniref:D-isomer specific 2-hydroxyacid dehydrogenase NAD-binding domain-containing protein n=1 Tax=Coleophoma crateriformis TaxID=565419 RepID=A0A3D8T949_9HELO|nr:hypothetical protein BP5796_00818 [Coleophoma crateriformis]
MAPSLVSPNKPIVLHIGDPVKWNLDQFSEFSKDFTIIRPSLSERQRPEFMKALQDKRWGDFAAIFRPFWNTGGEMGRWDRDLIPLLPESCRIFAAAGAGFDWADVDLLAERAASESVADFALFQILATFRHLNWCTTSARSTTAAFTECHMDAPALSHNPRNHTLGIIGLGAIGQLIAQKAHLAFGMRIRYFDIVRKSDQIEMSLSATFDADLDGMLRECDCVVLATPASPDGRKIIDAERLKHFKTGSRFVNIARGVLVDEEALADALDEGRLCAAALDVHEHEPVPNERLKDMRNVTLTTHNAGGTLETHIGFESWSMRNIDAVLKGREPLTPVNLHLFPSVEL